MPRPLTRGLAAIFGAAGLLAVSQQVLATSLAASAYMDWSRLTIEFVPDGFRYSLGSESSTVAVGGMGLYDVDSATDWTTPLSAVGPQGLAKADAGATADSLSASAELQGDQQALYATLVQIGDLQSFFLAPWSTRSGSLTISGGTGYLLATIPVTVFAALSDADGALSPYVYANAVLNLENDAGVVNSAVLYRYMCFDCDSQHGGEPYRDSLVVAFKVSDGDVLHLTGSASVGLGLYAPVPAPVPLPAALWLFCTALGVAGLARIRGA